MLSRVQEDIMDSTFDIFKLLPGGPLWVAAAPGLKEANEQMARLALSFSGRILYSLKGKTR